MSVLGLYLSMGRLDDNPGNDESRERLGRVCMSIYWGLGIIRAESSDLSHMGVYMGMGVISGWVLLRANTVSN